MKIVEDEVLKKMNLQRLKQHRLSVLAHISKHFYSTEVPVGCDCADCWKNQPRVPVNHDTDEFKAVISYRNKVNKYYDAARSAVKVK
jgi:hypothetical protein